MIMMSLWFAPRILAPVNLRLLVVGESLSIRRIRRLNAHVSARFPRHTAVDAHEVQLRGEVFATIAAEQYRARVVGPPEHNVVSGMAGQLFRVAAARRNQKDVEIAVALAREGDPLSVGREASINIAGAVYSQTLDVLAVLVSSPNVSEVSEDDSAVVIMRIAHEARFASKCRDCSDEKQSGSEESDSSFHGS
jgi:hypothetical protein